MNEKRFIVKSEKIGRFHNIFVQTDKIEYLLTGDFDNDSEMMKEIVDKLNEQQELIESLKKDVAYYEKLNENRLMNIKGMFDEK